MNPVSTLDYRYRATIVSLGVRLSSELMKLYTVLFAAFTFTSLTAFAQDLENPISKRVTQVSNVPSDLLAKRTCVFYSSNLTDEQLDVVQNSFQKTGIDAVAYFKIDFVFAGVDVVQKVTDFLVKREISFIAQIERSNQGYNFLFTPFSGDSEFVKEGQPAWRVSGGELPATLQDIYRIAVNNQPIKNLLVNDFPEKNFPINIIDGRRSDFFAIDLKVDRLAVPWFKNAANDTLLANFFKEVYPFNYGFVEPGKDRKQLRADGFHYEMCVIHTEGDIAREVLGYPVAAETAYTSVTYPNGEPRLKTFSTETPIYKFYFRHTESGNVFLGTKWDADTNWLDALRNHIKGFKAELKIP